MTTAKHPFKEKGWKPGQENKCLMQFQKLTPNISPIRVQVQVKDRRGRLNIYWAKDT